MTEKIKICSYCALLGSHKDHEVRSYEEIMSEVHDKAKFLLEILEMVTRAEQEIDCTVMEYLDKAYKKIIQKKTEIEEKAKKNFKKIRKAIDTLEKNTMDSLQKNIDYIENMIVNAREMPKKIYS
jgi:hypothetical protein